MTEYSRSSERAHLRTRTVIASMVGLWLCYFLLTTLRGTIVGLELQTEMLWRRGVVSLAGVGATFVLWLVLRLFERRALWVKISAALVFALPAAVLIAQVNQTMFSAIEDKFVEEVGKKQGVNIYRDEAGNLLVDVPSVRVPVEGADGRPIEAEGEPEAAATLLIAPAPTGLDKWRQLTDIALGRYFLLLAWASLYLALLAGAQARAAERRAGEFRQAAKAAELRSLRYQVNPHFLFNTLNSLSSMVMTGKTEKAEEMIQTISNFYRHSLADDASSDVALADEFDLQRHYLAIEAVRFPERLRPEFELPDELGDARIPGMILQPLVENSVKYAVAPVNRPVTVRLSAREEYGRLVVEVSDDGPGVPADVPHGFGIGLANVRDRLEARFGKEAAIASGPAADGYHTIIRMPLVKHG